MLTLNEEQNPYGTETNGAPFPLISVVVPTKDRPETLRETLDSIFGQTFENYEIVIVNDGGRSVGEIISSFGEPGNITLIERDVCSGPSAARNTAVDAAEGDIIVYLDDDDIYLPNHLSAIAQAMSKPNAPPVAYTRVEHRLYERNNEVWTVTERDVPPGKPFCYSDLLVKNFIPLNCLAHRKDLFLAIDGFDTHYPFLEDWEMLLRLTKDIDVQYIDAVTAVYRHFSEGSSVNALTPEAIDVTRRIYETHWESAQSGLEQRRHEHLGNLANAIRLQNRQKVSPPVEVQLKAIKEKLAAGQLRQVILDLDTLLERIPDDGELLMLAAKLKTAAGEASEGERLIQRAKEKDPYLFPF